MLTRKGSKRCFGAGELNGSLSYFYILNMESDTSSNSASIILGRPFLKSARTRIDVYEDTLTMEFVEDFITF